MMFKIIKQCPLCNEKKIKSIIKNKKNVYSFFISKILKVNENYILENMKNYKCYNCNLIYKKNWLKKKHIKKIYTNFQPTHPGGLNTLKKNFSKKKFIFLINNYKKYKKINNIDLAGKAKREIIKILNSAECKKKFIDLRDNFIKKLSQDEVNFINENYINLSKIINKPKVYSQFSGFKSQEISDYLNSNINLKQINSYAEVGCPLWGNYDYFRKDWIKRFFIDLNEVNFWNIDLKKKDNCIKYLSKKIAIKSKLKPCKVDFIGIYNFLDHLENPLGIFKRKFRDVKFFGLICEDYTLSKKIDCQHFSSWNSNAIKFLSKKIGYKLVKKPIRLHGSIYKFYILKKKFNLK
jgi:hypothetical protein